MNADSSSEKPVQRLRDRLREATGQAILDAAEATLGERGLEGAGMAEIAARAGVAVGTLYNHFQDRDALFTALIADRRRELLGRIDTALDGAASDPFRQRLVAVATALFDHVDAHRQLFGMILEEQLRAGAAGDHQAALADIRARIDALMRRGVREGALRREHATAYPALFLGMLKGSLIHEQRLKRRTSSATLAETVVGVFLDGATAR